MRILKRMKYQMQELILALGNSLMVRKMYRIIVDKHSLNSRDPVHSIKIFIPLYNETNFQLIFNIIH